MAAIVLTGKKVCYIMVLLQKNGLYAACAGITVPERIPMKKEKILRRLAAAMIAISLLLSALLILSGCSEDDPDGAPSGMKLASDPKVVDYYLYVPEDWIVLESTGMTRVQVSAADTSNVIVTNHANSKFPSYSQSIETVREYYDYYIEQLKSKFDTKEAEDGEAGEVSTFEIVSDPTEITLKKGDGEVAALKVVYKAQLDGTEIQQILVICYEDDYFYNITLTTAPYIYESNEPRFEAIIKNFKFKD